MTQFVNHRRTAHDVRRPHARGFSLTEILFAVVILGIGLIMVAAIFPVAIQQSKTSHEETIGAGNARDGAHLLDNISVGSDVGPRSNPTATPPDYDVLLRPTGYGASAVGFESVGTMEAARNLAARNLLTLNFVTTPCWDRVRGNVILRSDPRYAWVPLYRRDGDPAAAGTWKSYAQVTFIQVQAQNTSIFGEKDLADYSGATPAPAVIANLQPRPIDCVIQPNYLASGTDVIRFFPTTDPDTTTYPVPVRNAAVNAVAEGAFVVIRDDRFNSNSNNGRMNGRIYRVGARRADLDGVTTIHPTAGPTWELMPGYGFVVDAGPDGRTNTADDINVIGKDCTGTQTTTIKPGDHAWAWVVGRGFSPDLNGATPITEQGYVGPAMDIGLYTTWVRIN